jgi:hypothetical protein
MPPFRKFVMCGERCSGGIQIRGIFKSIGHGGQALENNAKWILKN